MAYSRKYKVYKYRYQSDNNNEYIRQYREYKQYGTNEVLIPVTATFLSTVIQNDKRKVNPFDRKVRRAIVELDNDLPNDKPTAIFNVPLPYPPLDIRLKQHLTEIRQTLKNKYDYICVNYSGETR